MATATESTGSLERELRDLIVAQCNILEPVPEVLPPDVPLIGPESPWGLDSLDAVELVVAIQKKYGVRIGSQTISREVLKSPRTLTDYIRQNLPAQGN